jgi:hypothetical protein
MERMHPTRLGDKRGVMREEQARVKQPRGELNHAADRAGLLGQRGVSPPGSIVSGLACGRSRAAELRGGRRRRPSR